MEGGGRGDARGEKNQRVVVRASRNQKLKAWARARANRRCARKRGAEARLACNGAGGGVRRRRGGTGRRERRFLISRGRGEESGRIFPILGGGDGRLPPLQLGPASPLSPGPAHRADRTVQQRGSGRPPPARTRAPSPLWPRPLLPPPLSQSPTPPRPPAPPCPEAAREQPPAHSPRPATAPSRRPTSAPSRPRPAR